MIERRLEQERITFFQDQLNLGQEDLDVLEPYRALFVAKKDAFAEYFYNFFYRIARTRIILRHERRKGFLREMWAEWFANLFSGKLDSTFISYNWRGGLRHVELNLDQRYSNLGYSVVRQFCHRIISQEIPLTSRGSVMLAIDKILDFCVLIETNAYMVGSSYCDKEVIKGISHQIRNPITVIGGNARRLEKKTRELPELQTIAADILDESRRLERLVTDIGVYMEVFQREAKFGIVTLGEMIQRVLNRLSSRLPPGASVELQLDESVPDVQGDPRDLEAMFYYLLENSAEAVSSSPTDPRIRISSRIESFASLYVRVEIFNSGPPPKTQDIDNLFSPFYSSKPTGTGFGLPIAELAARKNFAMIHLMPSDSEGTRCFIDLPLPG